MFMVLDELKNVKASMINDFSSYKKSMTHAKVNATPDFQGRLQETQMFLITQGRIWTELKERLQGAPQKLEGTPFSADNVAFTKSKDVGVNLYQNK